MSRKSKCESCRRRSRRGRRGKEGKKGERGDRGPRGRQGEQGPIGMTGSQGNQGPVGPSARLFAQTVNESVSLNQDSGTVYGPIIGDGQGSLTLPSEDIGSSYQYQIGGVYTFLEGASSPNAIIVDMQIGTKAFRVIEYNVVNPTGPQANIEWTCDIIFTFTSTSSVNVACTFTQSSQLTAFLSSTDNPSGGFGGFGTTVLMGTSERNAVITSSVGILTRLY